MLQLIADTSTLDISNASFNLTLKSPLAGESAGSYVFSVTIPYTNANAAAFGFPARLTRMEVLRAAVPGRIKYNKKHVQKGEWQAKTSTPTKTIQLEMLIGKGLFANTIFGKLLPDLFTESFTYASIITHAEDQVTKTWPEVSHNFPSISNPNFYPDEINTQFEGVLNNFEEDFLVKTINNNCLVPQLYLLHIVRTIYEWAGYTVTGDPFNDAQFKKALIYNNYALDKLVSSWFYADVANYLVILTNSWVILWNSNIQDPGSHYTAATGKYNVTFEGPYQIQHYIKHKAEDIIPTYEYYYIELYYGATMIKQYEFPCDPDVTTVYEKTLQDEYEVDLADIGDDFYTKMWYLDDGAKVYETRIVEGNIIIQNLDTKLINEYEDSIEYKNHVPEKDVKEFLDSFLASAKILPFFNETTKIVELVYLKNLLKGNNQSKLTEGLVKNSLKIDSNDYAGLKFKFDFQGPDDLLDNNFKEVNSLGEVLLFSNLPFAPVGAIYLVTSLNAYYIRAYDEDTFLYSWEAYGDEHTEVIKDDGGDDISTQMAPMLMRNAPSADLTVNRHMPAIYAPGTSVSFGIKNEFPIRIMFWYGMEYDTTSDAYPFASSTKYRTAGSTFLDISWTWPDIIKTYWEEIIAWYKRREKVEFMNVVTPSFISNLNFQDKFRFQKTLIFLEEAFTKIQSKSFGPGKFKGWTK